MANSNLTPSAARLEEALTVLFCLIDEAYDLLNPSGSDAYSSLKRLSDSEVLTRWPSSSSLGAWRASDPSSGARRDPSRTCSLA
jgi:hypothetical protein